MTTKQELGLRIRQIRMVKGMTQTTFAKAIGNLATSTVSSYEKGVLMPQQEALVRIAEIGGVSLDDLFKGGNRFDEVIGRRALEMGTKGRMRDNSSFGYNPSAGEVRLLIERLNGFQKTIEEVSTRLISHEAQMTVPIISEDEERLLKAFRALSTMKQKRVLEDTEEWAKAIGRGRIETF